VTPSEVCTEGAAVCARATTDNRERAAHAANHLIENLVILKYLLVNLSSYQSPRGTMGWVFSASRLTSGSMTTG